MDATTLGKELIDMHAGARKVSPFSERDPALTAETGYAASRALHEHRLAAGWKPLGRKIGFTNRSIWPRYGVYQPIFGFVYDRTVTDAPGNAATLKLAGLAQPRIEPEISFGLKARPPQSKDPAEILAAIDWVAHSIEIVQCTLPGW